MRIGILGGSFDPLHNGHLFMAKKAYEQYNLDEVWLIPNGHAPHKDETKMTLPYHRLNMCNIAAQSVPYLKVCDIEINSNDYSYTYLTLQKLTSQYPDVSFYFIMGADSLDYLEDWKNPEIICSLCTILVVNRDEFTEKDLLKKISEINTLFPADIKLIHCEKYDVSSSEIRKEHNLEDVLPEIKEYIISYHLYDM